MKLVLKLRENIWANYFVIFTRLLIGFAFIPSGLIKLYGKPFTSLPKTDPVGYFFDAMYNTGVYWNFLGFCQLLAAFLLMTQKYANIGAGLFLGIIVNIVLITYGIGFGNTTIIAFLMLLAVTGLLLWDYQKYALLFEDFSNCKNVKIASDLISKKWNIYGFSIFIFLTLWCSLPYIIKDFQRFIIFYILVPFIVVSTSFIYMLYKDFRQFKSKEKHEK
jgi:hypothetical protein